MDQATLLVHASLVLSIGVLTGVPYWLSILGDAEPATIQSWRVTHAFLAVDGLFMLVFGLAMPSVVLSELGRRLFVLALIASGWGFVLAFLLGAITRRRGLSPAPFGLNTVCFAGHALGATGSIIALGFAVYGFFRALH